MMLARQYLREIWWIALGYFVILEGAMVAAIVYWPQFRDNIPAAAKLVPFKSLQDLLTEVANVGFWPYFATQQWFKGCSFFGVAAIAFMGSGIIAREADQRTAEFLLSRPVSRRRILLTRFAVLALATSLPIIVSSVSAVWISRWTVSEYLGWGETVAASIYMSAFMIMLCGSVTLLSVLSTHQFRAGAILVGLSLANFAIYLIESINRFSLFNMIDLWTFMKFREGAFPTGLLLICIGATAVQLVLADVFFRRRTF
jgi:ABC-type transport system involved in multi-copper enzyme maturation permease subunit